MNYKHFAIFWKEGIIYFNLKWCVRTNYNICTHLSLLNKFQVNAVHWEWRYFCSMSSSKYSSVKQNTSPGMKIHFPVKKLIRELWSLIPLLPNNDTPPKNEKYIYIVYHNSVYYFLTLIVAYDRNLFRPYLVICDKYTVYTYVITFQISHTTQPRVLLLY